MEKIKLIALCGKAGSGKDTLLHYIAEHYPDTFHEIVSCTTRPPREGEKDGVNYHFLTVEDFTNRLLNGDLIEATEFRGWHYGTLKSTLREDKINIGVFNLDGIDCLYDDPTIDLTPIYIHCSDKQRLLRQLNREKDPDVDEILRRFETDREDFAYIESEDFDFYVNETPADVGSFKIFLDEIL